jgi:predicted amidohydrolase
MTSHKIVLWYEGRKDECMDGERLICRKLWRASASSVLSGENLIILTENPRARPVDPGLATKYIGNSLCYESQEMRKIQTAASEANIAVVLGFSENEGDSLYISQCVIDAGGKVVMKRRKLKPTHMERTYCFLPSFLHGRD